MSDPSPVSPSPRERDLLLGALEKEPAERAAFLDAESGGDAALRVRVEESLRENGETGSVQKAPADSGTRVATRHPGAAGPGGTEVLAKITEQASNRIGRYRLLQHIGEGGCGVVCMAEQEEPVPRRVLAGRRHAGHRQPTSSTFGTC